MNRFRYRSRYRRGKVVVLAAFLMTFLLGMIAFAVDCGIITLARAELQNAADAGAMAGADALVQGTTAAQTAAQTFAQANTVVGASVSVTPATDIQLGTWDKTNQTFTALSGAAQSNANAVQVTCRVNSARGNALNLFFAKIFGRNSIDLSASSIATASAVNCGPFVGINKVDMSGSAYTDSYDSSQGAYSAGSAGSAGHVCSNGQIKSSSSGYIHGDAHSGPGYTTIGLATGSTTALTQALNEPAVDVGDAATNNNNNNIPTSTLGKHPLASDGKFTLSGSDSVTLPPGTYYFTEMNLSGSSSVSVTGQTIIYCTSKVAFSGGTVTNTTALPINLQIYCTGNSVALSGSSAFYGVVYAPTADIALSGSSGFFGMFVGKTLSLSGSVGCHYDQSLGALSGATNGAYIVQ